MMEKVNPQRGEVKLKVGGHTFTLCCELGRLAAWMHEIELNDLGVLSLRLQAMDPRTTMLGLQHLCISDNAEDIPAAIRGVEELGAAVKSLSDAMSMGQEDDEKRPPVEPAP